LGLIGRNSFCLRRTHSTFLLLKRLVEKLKLTETTFESYWNFWLRKPAGYGLLEILLP